MWLRFLTSIDSDDAVAFPVVPARTLECNKIFFTYFSVLFLVSYQTECLDF